jgi:hypothetical protein
MVHRHQFVKEYYNTAMTDPKGLHTCVHTFAKRNALLKAELAADHEEMDVKVALTMRAKAHHHPQCVDPP